MNTEQSHTRTHTKSEKNHEETLGDKMSELINIKEELRIARDNTTQAWLDSRPVIEKLERLKSSLATAESRHTMSDIIISEIKTQLDTINMSIRTKREEEFEATKMINETHKVSDETREKMERLKHDTDEERKTAIKLKQTLRLKKQTLLALQLTLRAIRMEMEAYDASSAEAFRYISNSEMENGLVKLSNEEYDTLRKRVEEENSLADWRISISMEQKLAAEESRDMASTRLKELNSRKRLRERELKGKFIGNQVDKETNINKGPNVRSSGVKKQQSLAEYTTQPYVENPKPQFMRRSKEKKNRKLIAKKKASIFSHTKLCILGYFRKLFK